VSYETNALAKIHRQIMGNRLIAMANELGYFKLMRDR